jgi:hypothetical protein
VLAVVAGVLVVLEFVTCASALFATGLKPTATSAVIRIATATDAAIAVIFAFIATIRSGSMRIMRFVTKIIRMTYSNSIADCYQTKSVAFKSADLPAQTRSVGIRAWLFSAP